MLEILMDMFSRPFDVTPEIRRVTVAYIHFKKRDIKSLEVDDLSKVEDIYNKINTSEKPQHLKVKEKRNLWRYTQKTSNCEIMVLKGTMCSKEEGVGRGIKLSYMDFLKRTMNPELMEAIGEI